MNFISALYNNFASNFATNAIAILSLNHAGPLERTWQLATHFTGSSFIPGRYGQEPLEVTVHQSQFGWDQHEINAEKLPCRSELARESPSER